MIACEAGPGPASEGRILASLLGEHFAQCVLCAAEPMHGGPRLPGRPTGTALSSHVLRATVGTYRAFQPCCRDWHLRCT